MSFELLEQGLFWNRKIRPLTDGEVLFFLYLVQSERTNAAGIFRATLAQISADSADRWTPTQCRTLLETLQRTGLILQDGEWIWIIGKFKRNVRNPNSYRGAGKALAECESKLLFDKWWEKYGKAPMVAEWVGQVAYRGRQVAPADMPEEAPAIPPVVDAPKLNRDDVERVWAFYTTTHGVKGSLTPRRRRVILERLRETVPDPEFGTPRTVQAEDLMRAVANVTLSQFHMGKDPKTNGHRYNSLEDHILKNRETFEKWFFYSPTAPATRVEREKDKWQEQPAGDVNPKTLRGDEEEHVFHE